MARQPTQGEEERAVRDFFDGAGAGFFVEVGANHPTRNSQSWHLEQAGWAGILVEPQPDLAAFLVTSRKAQVFAVACSSPEHAGGTMPLHVAGPMSSLDRSAMAAGARAEYTLMVPIRTLDDILAEAGAEPPVDLVSIDVEGHELDVLRGFDLDRWRPRLILLEDHVESLARHRHLKRRGYRLVRRLGFNGWYVPANSSLHPDGRERFNILRKYYLALPFRKLRNASRRLRGKAGG